MGRNTDLAYACHQELGNPVIDHTLTGDRSLFLVIERGGVVLEVLDQGSRFRAFEKDFSLPLVDTSAAGHDVPQLSENLCTLWCTYAAQI